MSQTMKINTRTITPAIAAKYLKHNTSNRPLSEGHVAALASAMERGEWQLTGESIKFSTENTLLDGQHRLHAIVKSKVTVKMVVIEGLPPETFHVIDTGAKSRGASDILAISGEENSAVLAAAASIIGNYENDHDLTKRTVRLTVPQIEEIIARHPNLRKYAEVKPALKRILSPSLACSFSYLFAMVDEKASAHFMERLATGVGLEKNNPILLLRDMLIANKVARSKYQKKVIAALVIKAFNNYRAGKNPTTLRWRTEEQFPEIADMPAPKVGA